MNKADLLTILGKLGLTEYESRTLSTLFNLKEAKAPVVSRHAQVPKTRVYDVLDSLVSKGLIIEIRGRPKKYRLIEPKKTLKKVAESKRREIEKLEEEIEKIVEEQLMVKESGFEERVMKVKNCEDFVKILSQEVLGAEKSVICFSDLTKGHPTLRMALKRLNSQKKDVRVLHSIASEETKKYAEHAINSKHFLHEINAFIIDDKKLILALNDLRKEKPEYHFTIWHHPQLVRVMKNHFQECWDKAK